VTTRIFSTFSHATLSNKILTVGATLQIKHGGERCAQIGVTRVFNFTLDDFAETLPATDGCLRFPVQLWFSIAGRVALTLF